MKPEKIERRPSTEERLEVLRELFPEVFTDGRVAIDRLKELLEDAVSDGPADEHYALTWPGKQQARRLANQPPHVTLRPVPKAGVDEETTGNMVIVGDNLQVLLALQKSYASSIKLVYVDPPYNTGNDFIYKDTFAVDEELYLHLLGRIPPARRLRRLKRVARLRIFDRVVEVRTLLSRGEAQHASAHPRAAWIVVRVGELRFVPLDTTECRARGSRVDEEVLVIDGDVGHGSFVGEVPRLPHELCDEVLLAENLVH